MFAETKYATSFRPDCHVRHDPGLDDDPGVPDTIRYEQKEDCYPPSPSPPRPLVPYRSHAPVEEEEEEPAFTKITVTMQGPVKHPRKLIAVLS